MDPINLFPQPRFLFQRSPPSITPSSPTQQPPSPDRTQLVLPRAHPAEKFNFVEYPPESKKLPSGKEIVKTMEEREAKRRAAAARAGVDAHLAAAGAVKRVRGSKQHADVHYCQSYAETAERKASCVRTCKRRNIFRFWEPTTFCLPHKTLFFGLFCYVPSRARSF